MASVNRVGGMPSSRRWSAAVREDGASQPVRAGEQQRARRVADRFGHDAFAGRAACSIRESARRGHHGKKVISARLQP